MGSCAHVPETLRQVQAVTRNQGRLYKLLPTHCLRIVEDLGPGKGLMVLLVCCRLRFAVIILDGMEAIHAGMIPSSATVLSFSLYKAVVRESRLLLQQKPLWAGSCPKKSLDSQKPRDNCPRGFVFIYIYMFVTPCFAGCPQVLSISPCRMVYLGSES